MDDLRFCESFAFYEFRRAQNYHTNNRAGTAVNYLAKMKAGSVRLLSDSTEVFCTAGDFFFIPRLCRYDSFWTAGEQGIVFDSLGFLLFPGDTSVLEMQKLTLSGEEQALYRAFDEKTVSPHSVAVLYELMACLMPGMKKRPKDPQTQFTEQAVRFMKEHRDFSVGELAAHFAMSESSFYTRFRECAGCTPISMKHRLVAEEAADLLRTTDWSVETVCSSVGVSSPAYLRKLLRGAYGCTPKELRGGKDLSI